MRLLREIRPRSQKASVTGPKVWPWWAVKGQRDSYGGNTVFRSSWGCAGTVESTGCHIVCFQLLGLCEQVSPGPTCLSVSCRKIVAEYEKTIAQMIGECPDPTCRFPSWGTPSRVEAFESVNSAGGLRAA